MGNQRKLGVLTSVTAKRRKSWLLAASALASSSLGISEPALAQCTGPADNTICTPGGNDYPSGINVSTSNTAIKVTLEPGVRVVIPNGSPIANAVNLSNTTAPFTPEADATLTVNNAFIDNTLTFSAPNKSGLRIQASGNATITATDTEVRVTGAQSTNAIWAIVLQSSNPNLAATVNYNGPGVTSIGTTFSTVIQAENDGAGPAIINAAGDMTGVALGSAANGITGLFAAGGSQWDRELHQRHHRRAWKLCKRHLRGRQLGYCQHRARYHHHCLEPNWRTFEAGHRPRCVRDRGRLNALTATVASTIQMLGPAAPDSNLRNNGIGIRAFSFGDAPIR